VAYREARAPYDQLLRRARASVLAELNLTEEELSAQDPDKVDVEGLSILIDQLAKSYADLAFAIQNQLRR
jgi:hypothetical protein